MTTLSSFIHEDELVEAKNELAIVVTSTANTIEGWSKCVNNKGAPINRRGNDECSKRQMHAEDLIQMFQVIDNAKVALPSYAAVDYSRILPAAIQLINKPCQCIISQVTETLDAVLQRLSSVEKKMENVQCVQPLTSTVDKQTELMTFSAQAADPVKPTSATHQLDEPDKPNSFATVLMTKDSKGDWFTVQTKKNNVQTVRKIIGSSGNDKLKIKAAATKQKT